MRQFRRPWESRQESRFRFSESSLGTLGCYKTVSELKGRAGQTRKNFNGSSH